MTGTLVDLLIVLVILAMVFGVAWVVIKLILPKFPGPIGEVITIIFYGALAIVLILFVLVPLIRMIPAV